MKIYYLKTAAETELDIEETISRFKRKDLVGFTLFLLNFLVHALDEYNGLKMSKRDLFYTLLNNYRYEHLSKYTIREL